MKTSIYCPVWNILRYNFDYRDALNNWALYADQISIAVNTSDDGTLDALQSYAKSKDYPLSIVETSFDQSTDPFAYGKIENAALQNCDGDILIQQNLDERFHVDLATFFPLMDWFQATQDVKAMLVPTIDLYGSKDRYLNIGQKWYIHKQGLFRGAVNFGVKEDGRPDYNKTSTDELIDITGNLVSSFPLCRDLSIEGVRKYVGAGMPMTYHLGYLSLADRLDRSIWWKSYWEKATGGDDNKHPTSIEELAARETKEHGLPLWEVKS